MRVYGDNVFGYGGRGDHSGDFPREGEEFVQVAEGVFRHGEQKARFFKGTRQGEALDERGEERMGLGVQKSDEVMDDQGDFLGFGRESRVNGTSRCEKPIDGVFHKVTTQIPMPERSFPRDADLFDVLSAWEVGVGRFCEQNNILGGRLGNEGFDQIERVTSFARSLLTRFADVDAYGFVCHAGLFFDRLNSIFPVIMSLTQRMKQGFLRLPLRKQVVLLASAGLMVSPVLPWYDERNSFGVGETYLGIQGPFFLIGAMVMALGAVSFFSMFLPLLGKNFFNIKKRGGVASVLIGFQSALLMVVATSIFFHPDFGVNLSTKSTRFGMTFAFIMTGFMMIAGWLSSRKESGVEEEMDYEEDVQDVEIEDRPFAGPSPLPTSYTQERVSSAFQSQPEPVQSYPQEPVAATPVNGDPLTMDAKTRYRLMQSRLRSQGQGQGGSMHYGNGAGNLWGGRNSGTPYGGGSSYDSDNN